MWERWNSVGTPLGPTSAVVSRRAGTLKVRSLGTFQILGPSGWAPGPSRKNGRELIQFLVAYPEAVASTGALFDALWPDAEGDAALHRLHLAASRARIALRGIFGSDTIKCVGGGYCWSPDVDVRSDVTQLFAWYEEGSIASLQAGVDLYKGEFFAGERGDWLLPLRVRASSVYVDMLDRLAVDAFERSAFPKALSYSLRLIDADRGHEGASCMAMRCFAAMGRRESALETYEALQGYLDRRLGVEPTAQTQALLRTLVARAG